MQARVHSREEHGHVVGLLMIGAEGGSVHLVSPANTWLPAVGDLVEVTWAAVPEQAPADRKSAQLEASEAAMDENQAELPSAA